MKCSTFSLHEMKKEMYDGKENFSTVGKLPMYLVT